MIFAKNINYDFHQNPCNNTDQLVLSPRSSPRLCQLSFFLSTEPRASSRGSLLLAPPPSHTPCSSLLPLSRGCRPPYRCSLWRGGEKEEILIFSCPYSTGIQNYLRQSPKQSCRGAAPPCSPNHLAWL